MFYANSGDLHALIDKHLTINQYFSEQEILMYLAQMCLALKSIHSKHVIHRDIKSANIFVHNDGTR